MFFFNPFVMLIMAVKSLMIDPKTGKALKLRYKDDETNKVEDLHDLIISCFHTIQSDPATYYS